MLGNTIRVRLAYRGTEQIHEYPQMVEALGLHLANGGLVVGLETGRRETGEYFAAHPGARDWDDLVYWVTLDQSELVYCVHFNRAGDWEILGAAPYRSLEGHAGAPVRELYEADGNYPPMRPVKLTARQIELLIEMVEERATEAAKFDRPAVVRELDWLRANLVVNGRE